MARPKVVKLDRSTKAFTTAMITPSVIILLVMSVFALAFTIYYSFTDYYYLSHDPPKLIGIKNYITLFQNGYFRQAVWNTVKFTILCTVLETGLGILIAVFVNNMKYFRKTMRTLMILPYILPPVTVALIWKIMLSNNFGIINKLLVALHLPTFNWFFDIRTAFPVLVFIDVWQCTPFVFLLVYAALQSVPETLYEAARIDGANKIDEFFHVTLPGIRNTVVLCLLLRTIDSFRMFDKVNVLTSGGPANTTATITQFIYSYGIKSLKFGFGSAGSVVMAVLVLALSWFYLRKAQNK